MSMVDDALSGLAKGAVAGSVVPGIGTVIGGAAGGLLGVAMNMVPGAVQWLNGSADVAAKAAQAVQTMTGQSDPVAAQAALNNDAGMAGDLRIQLAQIANDARAEENRSAEARQTAALTDFVSARARDLALEQSGRQSKRPNVMLGITVTGIVLCLAVAIIGKLDGNSAIFGLIAGIVGVLVKCYADAFQFEFGSSAGSERKTGLLANSIPTAFLNSPQLRLPAPMPSSSEDQQ